MVSKNITLKVDSKIYDLFRNHCKKKGLIVSKQVELYIEESLRKEGILKKDEKWIKEKNEDYTSWLMAKEIMRNGQRKNS